MKKLFVPAIAAGSLFFATAAFATAQTKTGEIKSTDATKRELVLASGETFELGSNIKIEKLKVGEKVAVTYDTKDGKMLASKVHKAK